MGRKPLPPEEKKITVTFRITQRIVEEIKQIEGYNSIVEQLLSDYLKKRKK